MEFLKKHYEKLILSLVLLGLAGVAATLPVKVSQGKQREEERNQSLRGAAVKPLQPVDLTTNMAVLEKVKTPIHFDIAGKHNLFNPVPWIKKPNGEVVKVPGGDDIGIGALKVTDVRPLQMIITLDDVLPVTNPNGATEYKYQITVIREGAPSSHAKQSRAMSKGATVNNFGTLKEVNGPEDNPTNLVFVLPERYQVRISKDKPFTETIGYAADLLYDVSTPPIVKKNAHVGDPIQLGTGATAETYTITSIDKETVVFRAKSNQKQTPKRVARAP